MEFNKEKLKEDFIEALGQELCDEEEILEIYQGVIETVCNDYLSIQPVPVVFDNLIDEVSRYDINLKAIILNRKYKNDYEELLNSTLHELEHHWQLLYVSGFDTPKAKRWKHELENYNPDLLRSNNYICHMSAVRRDIVRACGGMDSDG